MQGTTAKKYCDIGILSVVIYSITLGKAKLFENAEYFFILLLFLALTVNTGAIFVTLGNPACPRAPGTQHICCQQLLAQGSEERHCPRLTEGLRNQEVQKISCGSPSSPSF